MIDEYLTIREAVSLCGASEKRLREAILSGEVSFYLRHDRERRRGTGSKLVKHVRISELNAWLAKPGKKPA